MYKIYKMELAITKMSPNGQVVIPSGIREGSGISPATKFLVFSKGRDILLKRIDERNLEEDIDFIRAIERSEEDIKNGRFVSVDSGMDVKDADSLLMEE